MKSFGKMMKSTLLVLGVGLTVAAGTADAASVHVAKDGDTYFKLARQYGVNMEALMAANPQIPANNIYDGLNIKLPEDTVMQAKSTTVAPVKEAAKISAKQVEAWGKTFNYSKVLNVTATAYSAAADENGGWGPVDYFGNPLKIGTIAVDPQVIPMGTKVLVTGHSHPGLPANAFVAEALDMGGAIKGNKIDIFIPGSKASVSQFGFQDIKLYFIED